MIKRYAVVILSVLTVCSFVTGCEKKADNSSSDISKSETSSVSSSSVSDSSDDFDNSALSDSSSESDNELDSSNDSKEINSEIDEYDSESDDIELDKKYEVYDYSDVKKDNISESDVAGKWELYNIESDDFDENEMYGIPLRALMRLEFEENKKMRISSFMETDEEALDWDIDENEIILKDENDELRLIIQDKVMIICTENAVMKFEKVDEFAEFDIDQYKEKMQEQFDADQTE